MALTKEQEELYRKTMEEAKKQMEHIEEEMEDKGKIGQTPRSKKVL